MPGIISRIRTRLFTISLKCRGGRIGKGSVLHFSTDVQHVQSLTLGIGSTIYKDVSIYIGHGGSFLMGNGSHAAPWCYFLIAGNRLVIGHRVAIGPFCAFFCHSNHPGEPGKPFTESYTDGDIRIGNNVFIGAHCTILPGTIIPDDVVIGANSVVRGNLESGCIYAGSPARKIKAIN